jgi:hypothetical protein
VSVDAGIRAIAAAVVDAGVAAAGSAGAPPTPVPAPASPASWWHDILTAGAGTGAVITAIVVIFGWWVTRRLERFKHELAEDLTKRKLRAEYVRGQIDHLYGPLAFLVEASARHMETHRSVFRAQESVFAGRPLSPVDHTIAYEIAEVANRYVHFVEENNHQAEKLLRAGWGWLDRDDVDVALNFITDVVRLHIEVINGRERLPPGLYLGGVSKAPLERPSVIRPEFIERISQKLGAKQGELAGLTGAEGTPQITSAAAAPKPSLPPPDAPPAPPASLTG